MFHQTVATLLEQSFGAKVESRTIDGEEFDIIISDGAHILVEITASGSPKTQERLERKRLLYTEASSVTPAPMVLAPASIYSQRAQALQDTGFEVIEPGEEALEYGSPIVRKKLGQPVRSGCPQLFGKPLLAQHHQHHGTSSWQGACAGRAACQPVSSRI